MNQMDISFATRVRTARKLGDEAGKRAADKADAEVQDFKARALKFIVAYVRQQGETTGENATLAAVLSGIRPSEQRAFGPVYQAAIRAGHIHIAGDVRRVRGHGSTGGKLYRPGRAPEIV